MLAGWVSQDVKLDEASMFAMHSQMHLASGGRLPALATSEAFVQ